MLVAKLLENGGGKLIKIKDFDSSCNICKIIQGKEVMEFDPIECGTVTIKSEPYQWFVLEEEGQSVNRGGRLMFFVYSHHVGAEMTFKRCILDAEAVRVAADLLGLRYHVVKEANPAVHYHAHLIFAGDR